MDIQSTPKPKWWVTTMKCSNEIGAAINVLSPAEELLLWSLIHDPIELASRLAFYQYAPSTLAAKVRTLVEFEALPHVRMTPKLGKVIRLFKNHPTYLATLTEASTS